MRHPHDDRARGAWQFVIFGLSLVVAFFVYIYSPEPEDSVRGYTPAGCHEQARQLFGSARTVKDVRRRNQLYASSVKYIEALEERFGIDPARWDAYEMLGDAYRELAATAESEREIARQLRLKPPPAAHAEALRAYRAATALLEAESPDRPRLLRKTTEVLLVLDRPGEALEILRGLVKLYRRDKIDRLRRERGEKVERRGETVATGGDMPGRGDEALRAYFLAGNAALAVAREIESRPGFVSDAEARSEADASRREAGRAFTVFLDSGGAGERRSAAETALGRLAFARAAAEPARARELLEEAAGHFMSAGTPEAEFLRARVLYAMGDCERALRIFRRSRADMSAAERRARRYMVGRCLLALGRIDDGLDERGEQTKGARSVFATIRSDERDDADGVASLVGLAEIALGKDDLEKSADHLLEAAELSGRAVGGTPLPERDREVKGPHLAGKLISLAEAFEAKGKLERAVDVYHKALGLDPARREALYRRIARAWERKAGIEDAAGRGKDAGAPRASAAEAYVELARVLPDRDARFAALTAAARLFERAGHRSRAIEVARRVVREWPEDPATPRVLHELATWEKELGLTDEALGHFRENVDRHWSDVHADRSLVGYVEALVERGGDADLASARHVLQRVLYEDTPFRRRYTAETFVRLQALFMLGRVDVRLADRTTDPRENAEKAELLDEALEALGKALAEKGDGSRPLFSGLIARKRPEALLLKGRALYGTASLERDEARRRERYGEAADAFAEAMRAGASGEDAEVHRALAECRAVAEGPAQWPAALAALERLGDEPDPERAILPAAGWREWSDWIADRKKEGPTDGGAD